MQTKENSRRVPVLAKFKGNLHQCEVSICKVSFMARTSEKELGKGVVCCLRVVIRGKGRALPREGV